MFCANRRNKKEEFLYHMLLVNLHEREVDCSLKELAQE